jgi:hypothetical protein
MVERRQRPVVRLWHAAHAPPQAWLREAPIASGCSRNRQRRQRACVRRGEHLEDEIEVFVRVGAADEQQVLRRRGRGRGEELAADAEPCDVDPLLGEVYGR